MEAFHLDPAFFPESTRSALPLPLMLELGVVPLGYKETSRFFRPCRRLNVGVVDAKRDSLKRVRRALKQTLKSSGFAKLALYRVEREPFVRVLAEVYGVRSEDLRRFES